jgi:hypothetical protein
MDFKPRRYQKRAQTSKGKLIKEPVPETPLLSKQTLRCVEMLLVFETFSLDMNKADFT